VGEPYENGKKVYDLRFKASKTSEDQSPYDIRLKAVNSLKHMTAKLFRRKNYNWLAENLSV